MVMGSRFKGKVVVVSGGSRGIGRAIATAFAAEGAQTVLAATSEPNLKAAADAIAATGALRPLICAANLAQMEGCERVFRLVGETGGRCDILVNSVGATRAGAFLTLGDDAWQDGFALKFYAGVRLSRLFWPLLKAANGRIVNIIGVAARMPDPEFLIGGAVNAAVNNFTKGLAALGKRDGVNVNAILPGLTETERVGALFRQRAEATGTTVEEVRAAMMAKDGLARLGQPEDVAALALFLASDEARHIQGTAIAVDGGATPAVY
jgi:NAD(P)-dependent dehydrogenase (short-subunit alcohol dehydrogenase family)